MIANATEALLSEGSVPNKRPRQDEPERFYDLMSAPNPQFQFQDADTPVRGKKKGTKRTDKRVDLTLLVRLMDETSGIMDNVLSVRQVLKNNKVDITWIDLYAWSPSVCREFKRCLIRIPKKRNGKAAQHNTAMPQF